MARNLKPVRFFCDDGGSGIGRLVPATQHSTLIARLTVERRPDRAAYAIGEKAGEEAPADAKVADRRRF